MLGAESCEARDFLLMRRLQGSTLCKEDVKDRDLVPLS